MISREDAEEYSTSLAQIGEGWVRQITWAFRQGVHEALGMSRGEWRTRYYGHLKIGDVGEREQTVQELKSEGLNNSEIADALGVSEGTVRGDLLRGHPQNYEPETDDEPKPQIEEPSFDPDSQDYEPEPELEPRAQLSNGDEWYTPRWLFDALDIQFSIDVCAPLDRTHSSVPAKRHLTSEDDGLAHSWDGTIWCNPPYSQPEPWARRLIHHGDGLLLTHMPMNAGWCVDVWESCDGIRLFQAMEFVRPDGSSQRPGYWLQLSAFGMTAVEGLSRLQPLGSAAFNKRRVASPMWRRA